MGRFLTGMVRLEWLLAIALSSALTDPAHSVELGRSETTSSPRDCSSREIMVPEENEGTSSGNPCAVPSRTAAEVSEARAYLIATAVPGYTMSRQGSELAIGRLHPEFATRLASAIQEARSVGLTEAGVFSAYRPPAFGVGGFLDKFESLHTYGLAVDMHGIGAAGSPEAHLWHAIAAKHGVSCPYGPDHPVEWNHCQPTDVKVILAEDPLRATVTADGPIKLEGMFEVGTAIINSVADPPSSTASDVSALITMVQESRLRSKQTAIAHPRQSAPVTDVAKKSGSPGFSVPNHSGFKRAPRDQAVWNALATSGVKIISVEEGRRMLRARSIEAAKSNLMVRP
jgi:hypothetical protein